MHDVKFTEDNINVKCSIVDAQLKRKYNSLWATYIENN